MSKPGRNIGRFIILIVALQILNTGLFAQDFQVLKKVTSTGEETNIINSVAEYVSEIVLQKTNSFPERKNTGNHHKHHLPVKAQTIKLIARENYLQPSQSPVVLTTTYESLQKPYLNFVREITPPPPKA